MELHSFNVGVFEMRSKANRVQFPDSYHPSSYTYCARIHNSSEERPREETLAVKVWRGNWHKCTSFQLLCIWGTTLNFLVAQAPQCEWCKSTGLHPSCLLYEDKTCIFRTLLFLWKGHRLVWNIKQLLPWDIKRTLEESGKLQKGFDGIYRSISSRYDGMKE